VTKITLPKNTFVIGCTHFGHQNIIRHAERPFDDVATMDAQMVARWNQTVAPDDTVVHLGDFFWNKTARDVILPKLNGRKFLLQGNHDPDGFGQLYAEARWKNTNIVLFHYPIDDWNKRFHGSIHIHAHTHSSKIVSAPGRYNVSAEAAGYTPIALENIVALHERETHEATEGESHG